MSSSYGKQTWNHPSPLSRFAHGDRLARSLRIVARRCRKEGACLDIGYGDAVFLKRLATERPDLDLFGHDPYPADSMQEGVFTDLPSLDAPPIQHWDCITCLETVEHLNDADLLRLVEFVRDHLHPSGTCLITSPVMLGPVLIAKELTRMALFRRVSDYSLGELLRAAFLLRSPDRPRDLGPSHKGYDFRRTYRFIQEVFGAGHRRFHFRITFGPPPALPFFLNSQAYLVVSGQ